MNDEIAELLWRNQGAVLTPELVMGLCLGLDSILSQPVASSVPSTQAPDYQGADHPRLVADDRVRVARWVAERVGQHELWSGFGAIGLADREGHLVAGFVVEGLTGTNAFVHIAGEGRRWLNKSFLFACFDYVFNQIGLKRITGMVPVANKDALRFDKHLGFIEEFVIKDGNPSGDVAVLGMRREDCRWLRG